MPPHARFKTQAIADLFEQLRYAPKERRLRHMNNAESLLRELQPGQQYPFEYIVFRITDYRPDALHESALLIGDALIDDIVNFIQRISLRLNVSSDFDGRKAAPFEDIARRINVSTRTLHRYRRLGLACHYVRFNGQPKLACFEDALDHFMSRQAQRVENATRFSRISDDDRERVISNARQFQRRSQGSLNGVARRIARRMNRSHEAIRLILQQYDDASEQPIFNERGPLSDRDTRVIVRSDQLGIPTADIARHFDCTPDAIRRVLVRSRAQQLRIMTLPVVEMQTFALDDAASVILSPSVVNRDLSPRLVGSQMDELMSQAKALPSIGDTDEQMLLAAYNYLKFSARARIDVLPDWPGAIEVDAVETQLRWSSMIKRRLIEAAFALSLTTIEQYAHRPVDQLTSSEVAMYLRLLVDTVSSAIEALDPMKDHRLDRVCTYAMNKTLAKLSAPPPSQERASAMHGSEHAAPDVLFDAITSWHTHLRMPRAWNDVLASLTDRNQTVITLRYGLHGNAPQSVSQISGALSRPPHVVARALHNAEREARFAARMRANS